MRNIIEAIDIKLLPFVKKISVPLARLALFTVFFWFGALKVFATSPANPLVAALLEKTLPFITFDQFIVALGIYEMLIGASFLFPGRERLSVALLMPHMVMTMMPLVLLPQVAWSGWFVPTLEGQYMIKNLLIIALALSLAARLEPLRKSA
jgi:uncharacterized membrane protein YkgB